MGICGWGILGDPNAYGEEMSSQPSFQYRRKGVQKPARRVPVPETVNAPPTPSQTLESVVRKEEEVTGEKGFRERMLVWMRANGHKGGSASKGRLSAKIRATKAAWRRWGKDPKELEERIKVL
jgi:hypothetical protein